MLTWITEGAKVAVVIVCRGLRLLPQEDAQVIEFTDSLQGLQEAVGGYLQEIVKLVLNPSRSLTVWADEDGLSKELSPNRRVITQGRTFDVVGPLVITASGDEGETYSLTATELDIVRTLAESWPRLL